MIYSDGWRGYKGLVDVGCSRHFRVNHGNNEFAHGQCHINGIESFCSFTRRRLAKFNGVFVTLIESEWRWKKELDEFGKELWKLINKQWTDKSKRLKIDLINKMSGLST